MRLLVCVGLIAGLAAADEPRGLLIVAPRSFHSALTDFVRHKRTRLPARLVALEAALEHEGVDHPERLKRYVFDAWRSRGVGYVLLVGDADVLPVRYMVLDRKTATAFDYAFYPSDLYYADLARADGSFDDWNARKEGFHARFFGEVRGEKNKNDPINYDAISYLPEIAVGRWPVSTADQARALARKTIAHEKAKPAGRTGLVSVGGWVDSRPVMERIAAALPGRVEKRYYGATPPPNEAEVVGLFEAGIDLLMHAGHGSDNRWEKCLSVATLERLPARARLPVVFSAGCSTAHFAPLPPYDAYTDVDGRVHAGTNRKERFTKPPPPPAAYQKRDCTGLGEQLVLAPGRGAVAYIGCNTGSQPCGLTLMEGFARAYASREHARLGDCWSAAVRYYHERERLAELKPTESWYPPSIFFQGMKFMLFGDPSLELAR